MQIGHGPPSAWTPASAGWRLRHYYCFEKELRGEIVTGELPPDALPMPPAATRVAEQAKGVQQDTPDPGLSEGNHKAFRGPHEKQDRNFGRTDR